MTDSTNTPRGRGTRTEAAIINDALDMSIDWHNAYVERHTYAAIRFTQDVAARLAIARYEWLLSTVRDSILSVFTDDELYEVAISLQRELAVPNDYALAQAIADDNSIILKNYRHSHKSTLIEKLLQLTPLEEMAVRDLLEPFWHRWQPVQDGFPEYIKKERAMFARPLEKARF